MPHQRRTLRPARLTGMRSISKTQCGGCRTYFTSTSEFDAHRTGTFGRDRRCMTMDEMQASGFKSETRIIVGGDSSRQEGRVWGRNGFGRGRVGGVPKNAP